MSCKIGRERREYIVAYLPFQNSHFNRLGPDFCCTSHLFAPFNFLIQTSVSRPRFCCTSHFLTEFLSMFLLVRLGPIPNWTGVPYLVHSSLYHSFKLPSVRSLTCSFWSLYFFLSTFRQLDIFLIQIVHLGVLQLHMSNSLRLQELDADWSLLVLHNMAGSNLHMPAFSAFSSHQTSNQF
jgi:hypothetical protein